MDQFNFGTLSKELINVEEPGVTFAGGSAKWSTPEDVKDVTTAIEQCKNLIFLQLEGNTLGVEAAEAIGKSLEKHSEFKKALWKDLFTGRLKSEIPQALKHLGNGLILASAQLTVLDCSDNALGPNGMVGLEDLLRSKVCYSLQELRLNNCGLGIYGGRMLSDAILDCHKSSTVAGTPLALKVFIAGRNRLENEGAKAISKIFSTVKTLEEIAMPQNSIFHQGIAALAEGFKENVNMRVLNLNDNIITHKGASALASAMLFMPCLREINFGDCLLKTNGAYHLAEILDENHQELETLILDCNEIGPDGGLALVSAIKNKPNLRFLNLDGNKFGSQCRERIIEMMEESTNPEALGPFEEDDSDGDDDDDEEDNIEDEEDADNHNDTTEEADEDDENYEDESCEEDDSATTANYVTALCNKTVDESAEGFGFNTSVTFTGEVARPNTVETFCNTPNPSLKMFNDMEDANKLEAFREYLKGYNDENHIIMLTFTALKCGALSQTSKEALDVAAALYADAFSYATKKNQVTRVMNFFLIQLGLLKCEQKTFKPAYNLKSCRLAFRQTLKKSDLPDEVKQTFTLFLDRFDD